MVLPSILIMILAGVVIFLAFKFVKSVMQVITTGIILIAILFAIFSYSLYKDVNDVSSHVNESRKTFLLVSNNSLITGFWAVDEFREFNESVDLENISANLTNRFFIFDREIYVNSSKTIIMDSRNFTRAELLEIIEAPSTQEALAKALNVDVETISQQHSESVLKAKIFVFLAQDTLADSKEMTREFKKGRVILKPQGPSFFTLKFLPNFITEKVFNIALDIEEV